EKMAPDFSVGCIEYGNGIVARVTCGLFAPLDRSLTIIGETCIIYTSNIRNDANPVYVQHIPPRGRLSGIERRINRVRAWAQSCLPITLTNGDDWRRIPGDDWHIRRKYPFARRPTGLVASVDKPRDFNRGPAELAEAV